MKIKYKTMIYSKKYPYGIEKTKITEGVQVGKPSYLAGCENCIFIKNSKNQIFIINPNNIIKIY